MTDVIGNAKRKYKKRVDNAKKKVFGKLKYHDLKKIKDGKPITVKIPVVDLPSIRYGPRKKGQGSLPGVGSGPGEPGDPLFPTDEGDNKNAGNEAVDAIYANINRDELINWMKSELELELIKPAKTITKKEYIYPALSKFGLESLFSFDDTLDAMIERQHIDFVTKNKNALMAVSEMKKYGLELEALSYYSPRRAQNLVELANEKEIKVLNADLDLFEQMYKSSKFKFKIKIDKDDLRYRFPDIREKKEKNAVIFFVRDVSGSISDRELRLSYEISLLVDMWIKESYNKVEVVYIAHNAQAWEETEEDYYKLQSGGGTDFTSAYAIIQKIFEGEEYPSKSNIRKKVDPKTTDVYVLQMTDGEDFNHQVSINFLSEYLMNDITRFCYYEMNFWSNSKNYSHFGALLTDQFQDIGGSKLRMYRANNTAEGPWNAMKAFFGKSK